MKHLKNKNLLEAIAYLSNVFRKNLFAVNLEGYYVFETDLEHFDCDENFEQSVQIDKFENTEENVNRLATFWPDYFRFSQTDDEIKKMIQRYMDNGDECFCAVINEEIAGMLWVGYRNNYMLKKMASKDGLSDGEAIIHRGFVKKSFRGKRLHIAINNRIFLDLQERGFRRVRRYVGINNIASIINNLRSNDRCRTLYHLELILMGKSFNFFPAYSKSFTRLKRKNS